MSKIIKIPLITSIPIRRSLDSEQVQFVDDGHLSCIKSWLDCGFSPISVNSFKEADDFQIPNVEMHLVEKDAYAETGKRLVYLEDMISAASKYGDGLVAITNADIDISLRARFDLLIEGLSVGSGAVGNRVDYSEGQRALNRTYKSGYDLHIFHINDLLKIDFSGFIFGAPWWDHYLPIAMSLAGVKLYDTVESLGIQHRRHNERWNVGLWFELGRMYRKKLLAIESKERRDLFNSEQRVIFEAISSSSIRVIDMIQSNPMFLAKIFASHKGFLEGCELQCMSRYNIRLIEASIKSISFK